MNTAVKHGVAMTSGQVILSAHCAPEQPSNQTVPEHTQPRNRGYSYPQLTSCCKYCSNGNLGSWSLQQCEVALLINPTLLLGLKQVP